MNWPSLSVIIPSYNQGRYIERTLLSILKQDYPGEVQVIVSDGGSTDETVEVLKKYPQVQWWSERDRGFADAVNKALAVATGEVVAIQSSDDYYLKDAFIKAVAVLREEKHLIFVTGNDVMIEEDGQIVYPPPKPYVSFRNPGALISRTPFLYVPQHCTFARRKAVTQAGGLREPVDQCADFDLWYRLLHFGPALMLPDYLAAYQRHNTQRTQNNDEVWIAAHHHVIEDAEANPTYAQRFLPSPEVKRNIFLQWEVLWNVLAGGAEGAQRGRALTAEALQHADQWPDYVLNYIRAYGSEPPPASGLPTVQQSVHTLLLRLRQNRAVRAMFGKRRISSPDEAGTGEGIEPTDEKAIALDWWRTKERVGSEGPTGECYV